jgi:hypothetical protein
MISFVNRSDKNDYIINYIDRFNVSDKKVRNLELYKQYFQDFTMFEKMYLMRLVLILNIIIYPFKNFYKIPWKFAKSRKGIEDNYPHTHKNIIILPYNFYTTDIRRLIHTIVHEKIHIYQRYNPIMTLTLYTKYWGLHILEFSQFENERANPDINRIKFYYYDPMLDKMVFNYQKYTDNPISLRNSVIQIEPLEINVKHKRNRIYHHLISNNSYQSEHPNEVMACLLADIIVNKKKHKSTETWILSL